MLKMHIINVILLIVFDILRGAAEIERPFGQKLNYKSWREQYVAKKLLNDYQVNIRPKGTNDSNPKNGGPVLVYTTLFLRSIDSINDANMEFSTQFQFQQEWVDERLRFEDMSFRDIDYINLAIDQKIWIPDTFFANEKRGHYHDVDSPNTFTRVGHDGRVIYNRRLSMTFACTMQLTRYPHDTQQCVIDFATYAYTTDDIKYVWSTTAVTLQATSKHSLPKFKITSLTNNSCTSKTNTGEYSCLRVDIVLKRVFTFFLLQLYIPSIMFVIVSCVSYWIDWKATAARVPLSIVSLLTMITQAHSMNSNLPPVSYTKALDLWIGTCTVFIFSSLIEYAVVNYTGVQEERRKAKLKEREKENQQKQAGMDFFTGNTPASQQAPATTQQLAEGLTQHVSAIKKEITTTLGFDGGITPSEKVASALRGKRKQSPPAPPSMIDLIEDDVAYRKHRRLRRFFAIQFCPGMISERLKKKGRAERIDMVSRVVFPILFLCFNVVYWTMYGGD